MMPAIRTPPKQQGVIDQPPSPSNQAKQQEVTDPPSTPPKQVKTLTRRSLEKWEGAATESTTTKVQNAPTTSKPKGSMSSKSIDSSKGKGRKRRFKVLGFLNDRFTPRKGLKAGDANKQVQYVGHNIISKLLVLNRLLRDCETERESNDINYRYW
ncbi:unnamed protein product [Euphydryas editha]|uniref:Uncharacterized protein n=1 Tax=Euphydryas editha TaxID=104508 RepID=A0AAU9V5L9_EUPED|nr:unnamed protein product [Euphydryas editha]